MYNNNEPNSAPPGSMSAGLPPGGGILVLGADRVHLKRNQVENNDFYGIGVVDYCVGVASTDFDCTAHPPAVEPAPDDNTYESNSLSGNGTNPVPFGGFEFFAADITYIVTAGHSNCFAKNDYGTLKYLLAAPTLANHCD